MTPEQVSRVLAAAALRDNRRVGPADVVAWCEDIGDLDPADALAAVSIHYRASTERLMPAHIRRIVAEVNRERAEAERSERLQRQLEALDAVVAGQVRDRSPEVKAMLAELAKRLGPGRPEAFRRPEWLENDRARERAARAEPNPAYAGPPPLGGHPLPVAVTDEELGSVGPEPIAQARQRLRRAAYAVQAVRAEMREVRELIPEVPVPTEPTQPTPAEETP